MVPHNIYRVGSLQGLFSEQKKWNIIEA